MSNIKVCILLAAYNGERFIEEQVKSIISQTYKDWKLIIRDDGSSDNTMLILNSLRMCDKRIEIVCDDEEAPLGAFRNFYRLTEYVHEHYDPDYVLYADQDDFWFEDKIEILLKTIEACELETGNKPILVHSNLQLADQNLTHINIKNSRDNVEKINKQTTFNNTIFQNNVYGCTTIANRLLIKKVLEEYVICENYDHWMALNASFYGVIFYLNKKLMLYRQHDQNVTGSYLTRKPYYKKYFLNTGELKNYYINLLNNIIVFDHFRKINNEQRFIKIDETTQKIIVSKKIIVYCLRNRIKKNTIHETLFFYFCLFYCVFYNYKCAIEKSYIKNDLS